MKFLLFSLFLLFACGCIHAKTTSDPAVPEPFDFKTLTSNKGYSLTSSDCFSRCCPKCPECPTDPEPDPDDKNIAELLKEMNRYRANAGVKALTLDKNLSCAAVRHSNDIGSKKKCTHTGSDGSSPWDRAEACGTKAYGEIVACGQRSAAAAIKAWYNSSGHKKLMLKSTFSKVGMGMKNNYWTAIFR